MDRLQKEAWQKAARNLLESVYKPWNLTLVDVWPNGNSTWKMQREAGRQTFTVVVTTDGDIKVQEPR